MTIDEDLSRNPTLYLQILNELDEPEIFASINLGFDSIVSGFIVANGMCDFRTSLHSIRTRTLNSGEIGAVNARDRYRCVGLLELRLKMTFSLLKKKIQCPVDFVSAYLGFVVAGAAVIVIALLAGFYGIYASIRLLCMRS